MGDDEAKLAELRELVLAIRDRVRARYPASSALADSGGPEPIRVPLADLMPIVHARDAAQAKMASIGSVNPRPGGPVNSAIQSAKRLIARSLGWMVRDQIVFNRGALACVEASIEALNDLNRAVVSLGEQIDWRLREDRGAIDSRFVAIEAKQAEISSVLGQLAAQWNRQNDTMTRRDAELRQAIADRDHAILKLTQSHEARAIETERSFRELAHSQHNEFSQSLRSQHAEFEKSLELAAKHMQRHLGQDMRDIKAEFERLIHSELRVIRQRGNTPAPAATASPAESGMDYQAFANRFRGSEDHVRENQRFYVGRFQGEVLDIGCGQGEFLDVMREAGVRARGIDLSADSVAYCRAKGLDAEEADLFNYLDSLPDRSLDGIFCSQVVEHLAGAKIPEMIRLCAAKLRAGGLLAIETPNPASLAIFATHFYLDPTHVRPVPSDLLAFYMQEQGMGQIEVVTRFPAADSFPELNELPEGVRNRFFGGLDYAIFAHKL